MAIKKLILDFQAQPIVGSSFKYRIYINQTQLFYNNTQYEVDLSYKNGSDTFTQIGIGTDLDDTIDKTLDYLTGTWEASGSFGGYNATVTFARVDNTIEIIVNTTAPENLITFWNTLTNQNNMTGVYQLLLRTPNPCEKVLVTNISTPSASSIFSLTPGNYVLRNTTLNVNKNIVVRSASDLIVDRGFYYAILNAGLTEVLFYIDPAISEANTTLYFLGNDLYIDVVGIFNTVKFSLDGILYQTQNSFPDLAPGTYTVYVKDIYGCIKTFTVTNAEAGNNTNDVTAYYLISNSNSIRFKKYVVWGNCGNYKTPFNTLSCEEKLPLGAPKPTKFIQLFQTCDSVKTQIKTSYENVEIAAGTTEITPTKIVRNIGVEDKRDCFYYTYNGNLAVTFISGNLYDYDTTDVIGTYVLNGDLPQYGTIGTWVNTPLGQFQVTDIRIDENGNKSLILNSNANISGNSTIQVIYNKENYDIWEFEIAMAAFENTQFSVGIKLSQTEPDEAFPDVFFVSEKISVKERWANTLEITWSNSKNTDVYFFSGISMINRLALADISEYDSDGDVTTEKTDESVLPIDATDYAAVNFQVTNLTTMMARKIVQALKHDQLMIEGIAYTAAENPETERLGKSNLYKVTAKLFEKLDGWAQGSPDNQTISTNVDLIGLLEGDGDDNYIKI